MEAKLAALTMIDRPSTNAHGTKDDIVTQAETADHRPLNNAGISEPRNRNPTATLYPKILKLADLVYALRSRFPDDDESVKVPLMGTVKLHGTHADIVFGSPTATGYLLQSRNQLSLAAGVNDNAGFATYMASLDREVILSLRDSILKRYRRLNPDLPIEGPVVIAGEWCGMGVQKKVAISKSPKFLAIISIQINGQWVPDWAYADIHDEEHRIYHVGQAGFIKHELSLNNVADSEEKIKHLTHEVENECPFAKRILSESGMGEGLVWKAVAHCGDPSFWCKSKGDLYAVSNVHKLPASAFDAKNRERVDNFARVIVTEARLAQGWDQLSQKDKGGLGLFLKWTTNDCISEEGLKMKELDISKNKLSPAIASIAKPWFLRKVEQNCVQ